MESSLEMLLIQQQPECTLLQSWHRNILPAAFGVGFTLLLCSAAVRPETPLKAPLTGWTGGAHCPKNQPIYRQQFLKVVNPNGKMLIICSLGPKPVHVPTKSEDFLDGIFQPAREAELLVGLSQEWERVLSCLCSSCQCRINLAVKTSCASGAVLSMRIPSTCSTCGALAFGKEDMEAL